MLAALRNLFKRRSLESDVTCGRPCAEKFIRETEAYLNRHLSHRDLPWPRRHPVQEDAVRHKKH